MANKVLPRRIWLLKTGEELPNDGRNVRLVRMAILAEELVRRGHEVLFWNACFNHQKKIMRFEQSIKMPSGSGYDVFFLKGRAYYKNISLARFFHQTEVAFEFRRQVAKEQKPDLILTALPTIELSYQAALYAERHGIPLVIDCRDMWPEVIEEQATGLRRLPGWLLSTYYRRLRKHVLRQASSIVGVTDKFLNWGLLAAGRSKGQSDRVFHLAAQPASTFSKTEIDHAKEFWTKLIGPPSELRTVVCLAGTLSQRLDLLTLTEACRLIADHPNAKSLRIVICGKGDLTEEFEKCAQDVPQVTFAGWRNAVELHVLMSQSDVGLLPYPPSFDFSNHFVNKIGEYLSYGLPILTGLDGITHDLLSSDGLKISYEVGNARSLADQLLTLPTLKSQLGQKAEAARACYYNNFDPEKIYPAFAQHLETISN